MAIFKRKTKSKPVADEQHATEPTPKPPPFRPRHTRENSSVSASGQPQAQPIDAYMARGPVYGYRKDDAGSHPNTPVERATRQPSSSYFSSSQSAPSFDSPILGNPKMQAAARDRGYINPHSSGDSGYNSAAPSSRIQPQASGEFTQKSAQSRIPRNDSGLLPALNFAEDAARPSPFPENSYDEAAAQVVPASKARDSVLKSAQGYSSPTEDAVDSRSILSGKSIPKQTRFEHSSEGAPPMPQEPLQYARQTSGGRVQQYLPASKPADESSPVPNQPLEKSSFYPSQSRSSQPQAHVPTGSAAEESRPYNDTSDRGMDGRISSLDEQRTSLRSTLVQSAAPPLAILAGFKVNKKGRILNEEGEPIGELVEGDIMDCVRQKANATGEVLDEYGCVVGRVRTLERTSSVQPLPSRSAALPQYPPEQRASIVTSPLVPQLEERPVYSIGAPQQDHTIPRAPVSRETPMQQQGPSNPHTQSSDYGTQVAQSPLSLPPAPSVSPLNFESIAPSSKPNASEPGQRVAAVDHNDTSIPSPVATAPSPGGTQPRPASLIRSLSESSMNDLSKPFARPSMSPVPENEGLPDEDRSPTLYSYRGQIPPADGPVSVVRMEPPVMMGSKAPPSGLARKSSYGQTNAAQYSSAGGAGSRHGMQQLPSGQRPGPSGRNSYNSPLKRSPLSSQENSPPESEESVSDDGRLGLRMPPPSTTPSNPPSVRAMASGQPRTYFTHAGRVTATPDEIAAAQAAAPAPAAATPKPEKSSGHKKRFSLKFGTRASVVAN